MTQEQGHMPQEHEAQSPSKEFLRIEKLLEEKDGGIIGKETKFGRVDIQVMHEGSRPVTEEGEAYFEIQIFSPSPEKTYSRFKMFSDGQTEASAQEGWGQNGEKIDPPFTLDEILGEIQ